MPDLLVVGTLHTMDPSRPRAQAALVREGKFARVGTREECERRIAEYREAGVRCVVLMPSGMRALHGAS